MTAPTSHAYVQPRASVQALQQATRSRRGRSAHLAGDSAEAQVARHYERVGAVLRERRYKTAEGEIDLVFGKDGMTVFVEVKQSRAAWGADSPVSPRQWRRLANAALTYLSERFMTLNGNMACRFDVALVGRDGTIQVFENAHSFDAF